VPTTAVPELPAFLFDGDCAFCSSCARFIDRRIPTDAAVVAWQFTAIDDLGVTVDEVDESVIWVASPHEHRNGPAAIAELLRSSTSRPWRAIGGILGTTPAQLLARPAYRLIARNRHRMPGGTPQCSLPPARRTGAGPTDETGPDPAT